MINNKTIVLTNVEHIEKTILGCFSQTVSTCYLTQWLLTKTLLLLTNERLGFPLCLFHRNRICIETSDQKGHCQHEKEFFHGDELFLVGKQ